MPRPSNDEIASRLHDDVMAYLLAAASAIHAAKTRRNRARDTSVATEPDATDPDATDPDATEPDDAAPDSLDQAATWLDAARDHVRGLIADLIADWDADQPDRASVSNPVAAAKAFLDAVPDEAASPPPICHWTGLDVASNWPWTTETADVVVRIVVEWVRNARRHSKATRIDVVCSVVCSVDGEHFQVTVRDDGVGYDVGRDAADGQTILRRRSETAGIELSGKSQSGGGTQWVARVRL